MLKDLTEAMAAAGIGGIPPMHKLAICDGGGVGSDCSDKTGTICTGATGTTCTNGSQGIKCTNGHTGAECSGSGAKGVKCPVGATGGTCDSELAAHCTGGATGTANC